jgi:hypothetical protein
MLWALKLRIPQEIINRKYQGQGNTMYLMPPIRELRKNLLLAWALAQEQILQTLKRNKINQAQEITQY